MLQSKILIVDDSASIRKIIEKILKDAGFKDLTLANDGEPALQFLKNNTENNLRPFDLVISDWHMPKMSGMDLLKAVRGDEKLKSTAFLMVTSSTEQTEIVAAIQAGVSDYIVKPFNANLIQEKIFKALNKIQSLKQAS
jgi:two-component system, chemotaxis family, chemotaxis protein CheY